MSPWDESQLKPGNISWENVARPKVYWFEFEHNYWRYPTISTKSWILCSLLPASFRKIGNSPSHGITISEFCTIYGSTIKLDCVLNKKLYSKSWGIFADQWSLAQSHVWKYWCLCFGLKCDVPGCSLHKEPSFHFVGESLWSMMKYDSLVNLVNHRELLWTQLTFCICPLQPTQGAWPW